MCHKQLHIIVKLLNRGLKEIKVDNQAGNPTFSFENGANLNYMALVSTYFCVLSVCFSWPGPLVPEVKS